MNALRVDADYRNTNNWQNADDEFNRFFRFADGGINNVSGFRGKSRRGGSPDICEAAFVVVVTNFAEAEWPDRLDRESGLFIYYGDNRRPGTAIADTRMGGNRLLEKIFGGVHTGRRDLVQPFLVFHALRKGRMSFMKFLGLAAPGAPGMSALEDLVAVWRLKDNSRFQNYRATFTILEEEIVPKAWLEDLVAGQRTSQSPHCPAKWKRWAISGLYAPLRCTAERRPRSRVEQLPSGEREERVLASLLKVLDDREFEFAALELLLLMDPRFVDLQVTPATRDGGRDIIARYRVGHDQHQVLISAAIEAKRWAPSQAVGVKPVARLMSRLRHRELGVFITTSFFNKQVQEELIQDQHPVLLVTGGDIARLLVASELSSASSLEGWIASIKARVNSDRM